jgi:glycosyltransferase involved in cell wall biosynthesis
MPKWQATGQSVSTPHPRDFYAVTKLLLMRLMLEPAGLVAMEGMSNGIPVLAAKRGGLPEIIGDAGFLFDIPARCSAESRDLPTVEEVEPWVDRIIRLWDHAAEYSRASQAARQRGQTCLSESLKPVYGEFFANLLVQPAPPLVP